MTIKLLLATQVLFSLLHQSQMKIQQNLDQVWRIFAETEEDVRKINNFAFISGEEVELDYWQPPSLHQPAHLFVPVKLRATISAELSALQLRNEVMIDDVTKLIKSETQSKSENESRQKLHKWIRTSNGFKRDIEEVTLDNSIVGTYAKFSEMETWFRDLANFAPDLVTLTKSPIQTDEGRHLYLLKIGERRETCYHPVRLHSVKICTEVEKPSIWIDGGTHAREWISPATVIYIIYKLVDGYMYGNEQHLLRDLDWYFMPMVNPDGYVYSHLNTSTRFWRKNRKQYSYSNSTHDPKDSNKRCHGVDLNRNFPYKWHEAVSTSDYHCSLIFRGPSPGSEKEAQAVMKFIEERVDSIKSFVSVHSYSQMVLSRWDYSTNTSIRPSEAEQMDTVGQIFADAIQNTSGTQYDFGLAADLLYAYSGGSPDWARSENIIYSYAIELRDKGQYGFTLPVDQALDVGEEFYQGVVALGKEIIARYKIADSTFSGAKRQQEKLNFTAILFIQVFVVYLLIC